MTKRFSWLLVALAALCAALAGFWLARELDSSAPQLASGTWLAQPRAVADFQLIDHLGRPFTAHDLQGKPSLVFFGFTHCPDVCPTTLVKLAQVKKAAAIAGLQVLFVTVFKLFVQTVFRFPYCKLCNIALRYNSIAQ